MISRNELMELLHERLQDSLPQDRIDQLAGDILAVEEGWEEMEISHHDMGYSRSDLCSSICWLADETEHGSVIRLFRKKK